MPQYLAKAFAGGVRTVVWNFLNLSRPTPNDRIKQIPIVSFGPADDWRFTVERRFGFAFPLNRSAKSCVSQI